VRHVIGVILAVVIAGVVFGGSGWGVWEINAVRAGGQSLTSSHGIAALAVLAAVGLLVGIMLVAPAVSPLATALPGLTLLAWSGLMLVSASRADKLIPVHSPSVEAGFRTLLNGGILALLGMVMVLPLFVPSRWRRRRRTYDDDFSYSDPGSLLG
jgi:uncharacterized membrane protein